MERAVRIGGVFFRSLDPAALADWYAEHLGIPTWATDPEGNRFELWEPAGGR